MDCLCTSAAAAARAVGSMARVLADRVIEESPRLRGPRVRGQSGLVTPCSGPRGGDRRRRPSAGAVASGRWTTSHPRCLPHRPRAGTTGTCGPSPPCSSWGAQPPSPDRVQHWPGGAGAARTGVGPPRRPGRPVGTSTRGGIDVMRSRRFDERIDDRAWPHRTTVEHTVLDLGMPLSPSIGSLAARRSSVPAAPHRPRLDSRRRSQAARTRRTAPLLRECLAEPGHRRRERRRGALHPRRRARARSADRTAARTHRAPAVAATTLYDAEQVVRRGGRQARARGVGRTGPRRHP